MERADRACPADPEAHRIPVERLDPYNLRFTTTPLRCVTGVTIPPGLVGFCWEVPLSLEALEQQAPELARVVKSWTDGLKPILEQPAGRQAGPVVEKNISTLRRSWSSPVAPNGP